MQRYLTVLFTAALALAVAHPAVAQALESVSTLPQAIASLHPRQRIRLETLGGERFFGRLLADGGDTVTLSSPLAPGWRTVRVDTVTRVWAQQGTQAFRGALIASSIGALLGALVAPGLCGIGEGVRDCQSPGVILGGFLGGAVLTAPFGLALGALIPQWRPLYPIE